ncbi:MAG: glycoside hydrolase [Clostridium lundense]|nr:glycoside hydrolase [Clostridium lundense]
MNKKLKIYASILTVIFINSSVVSAAPLSKQLQIQKQRLEQEKRTYEDITKKLEEKEIAIEHLDNKIQKALAEVEGYKSKISKTESNIEQVNKDITKAEEDLEKQQDLFNKRVRALYVNGQASYLDVLVEAEGFSDLMSRVENVRRVMKYDKEIFAEMESQREVLNAKKSELDKEKQNLVAFKNDSEKKLAEIKESAAEQKRLIQDLNSEKKIYASKINTSQVAVNSTLQAINQENARAAEAARLAREAAQSQQNNNSNNNSGNSSSNNGSTPSRGPSYSGSVSGNDLVAYAQNFLGLQYVWGGTTPSGFDCSGYMQYVYAHFGISIGRTTYNQIHNGVEVSRSELQPGDLVLFGTWNDPHHVGMYIGGNQYIHAPRTGDVIKISPLTRSDYLTARRILN